MKYLLKYGSQEIFMTDYPVLSINKIQSKNGQKLTSSPSPRKATLESLRTAIAAKVYDALLLNYIQPEIEKILRKDLNGF